jgi:cyclase
MPTFVFRALPVSHRTPLIPLILVLVGTLGVAAQEAAVNEISSNLLVFATSTGNVVCSVGTDGALLVGIPSAASTPVISKILASRTSSPVRILVIAPQDLAHSEGDAGWGKRGAVVAMHENALRRLGGDTMGVLPALSPEFVKLGVDRPRIAFSEVLAFDMNGETIHVVHQKPGYSDADALAHFHAAKLVYFGEVFPGDGYPGIDPAQGGTLDGVLKTLASWTSSSFKVVPARGKVTDGRSLKEFVDMIVTVRDRVHRSMQSGKTDNQIVAEHPTAEFDEKWGRGRVSADAFVREIYAALKGQ